MAQKDRRLGEAATLLSHAAAPRFTSISASAWSTSRVNVS
jgi:hypothetical protein